MSGPDRLRQKQQTCLISLTGEEIGDAIPRPGHAGNPAISLELRRGACLALLGVKCNGRAARAEIEQLRQRFAAEAQKLRTREAKTLGREVGRCQRGADGLPEVKADEFPIALAIAPKLEAGAAEKRLRACHLLLPVTLEAAHMFRVGGAGCIGCELWRGERPSIAGQNENERDDDPRRSDSAFDERIPSDEQTGRARERLRRSIGLFACENGLERRFEPAMSVLQRRDAPGDDIVMLKYLLHRARLLARELPVDIGD